MNLIILTEDDRVGADLFELSGKRRRHIVHVLRAEIGETISVGLLDGPKGEGLIEDISEDKVTVSCRWNEQIQPAAAAVDLICALPRPQTLKKVLQIAAAMKVENIHIVNSNRVEQCYFSASVMQPEAIRENLFEGLSQGKCTRLPKVTVNPRFRCFFEDVLPRMIDEKGVATVKLVADVIADRFIGGDMLDNCRRVCVAVGPEGGWVPFEMEVMTARGFIPVTIGDWTLRVENAVVAAVAQIELVLAGLEKT